MRLAVAVGTNRYPAESMGTSSIETDCKLQEAARQGSHDYKLVQVAECIVRTNMNTLERDGFKAAQQGSRRHTRRIDGANGATCTGIKCALVAILESGTP
jgi:hypothetical protein